MSHKHRPHWITAFIDRPAAVESATTDFWARVTGYALSERRGDHDEFATLIPPDGDAFLRTQAVMNGPGGVHLDLHVEDIRAATTSAVTHGATEIGDSDDWIVLRSPGGFAFCFVPEPADTRPRPIVLSDGSRSIVDQVCLDIAPGDLDAECAFWEAITGWEHYDVTSPEFSRLACPPGIPVRFLFQRLDAGNGPVRGHLDIATDDRAAETARHRKLGATVHSEHRHWTVLHDPSGEPYCITDRSPDTGLLD